jgi:hypothetical protein
MTRGCRQLIAQPDSSSNTQMDFAALNGIGNIAVYAHIMLLIHANLMYGLKKHWKCIYE